MSSNLTFHDDNILARFFGRSSNYTDIPNPLFKEHNVKKGLRNEDGTGVRIGLTRISDVVGYTNDEEGNVVSKCNLSISCNTKEEARTGKRSLKVKLNEIKGTYTSYIYTINIFIFLFLILMLLNF